MKKMTGLEFKQFMDADWDALLGTTNTYVDGDEIAVNGIEFYDDHIRIPDDAIVKILNGAIVADEDIDLSFEALFVRWKKTQTHKTVVVQVPLNKLEEFNEYIKTFKE
jgi:hypothetical protein